MKSSSVLPILPAVLAIGFALAVSLATMQAQAAEPAEPAPPSTGLTRAEVMAEYWRAKAAGELPSAAQVHGPLLSRALAASMGAPQAARMASGKP